ncbi:hypothetical protein IQ13_4320 [Lacibacter cauensis]|uniref:Uncharacterized protein n=1 Tax=Lacibacter cauensis TaxID=510947 RepID=A0A562S9M8_9BACT|nr:hypothetical protein [Lacibacter cauensis]TWI77514.1 hypothetical protein IQ13_4320 [Lacibacter cauensis]
MIKQKTINPQLKIRILFFSLPILLIIIYRFAVVLTIEEQKSNKRLLAAISSAEAAKDLDSANMLSADSYLDIVRNFTMDTLDQGKKLFEILADYYSENGIKITDYGIAVVDTSTNPQVITRKITVQGGFSEILQLIHQLENKNVIGRLQSASFKSHTDSQGEFVYLEASLLIQNLLLHEKDN